MVAGEVYTTKNLSPLAYNYCTTLVATMLAVEETSVRINKNLFI